jgi:hypothetical protein
MNKFSLDYNSLEKVLDKPKVYRYEDVKDKIVRVAYDIVRFQSPEEEIDALWQVQSTDDGEVIVAMYDEGSGDSNSIKSESSWNVVADSNNENMHIFYKDQPIKKIAAVQAGIQNDDVSSFCYNVSKRLNEDKDFRLTLLSELSNLDRIELFSKYPELTQ